MAVSERLAWRLRASSLRIHISWFGGAFSGERRQHNAQTYSSSNNRNVFDVNGAALMLGDSFCIILHGFYGQWVSFSWMRRRPTRRPETFVRHTRDDGYEWRQTANTLHSIVSHWRFLTIIVRIGPLLTRLSHVLPISQPTRCREFSFRDPFRKVLFLRSPASKCQQWQYNFHCYQMRTLHQVRQGPKTDRTDWKKSKSKTLATMAAQLKRRHAKLLISLN